MQGLVWQEATVTAVDGGRRYWLALDSLTSCERCLRGEGCGAGVFSRLFARRRSRLWVTSSLELRVGQRVHVGVSAVGLVHSALILYGLPLTAFLAGALAGHALAGEVGARDFVALAGGVLSALMTLGLIRKGLRPVLNPRIEALSCNPSAGCPTESPD